MFLSISNPKIRGVASLKKTPCIIFDPQNRYRVANIFCNYVPSGNAMSPPLYKRGEACGECPKVTECSEDYPGLCTSGIFKCNDWVAQW